MTNLWTSHAHDEQFGRRGKPELAGFEGHSGRFMLPTKRPDSLATRPNPKGGLDLRVRLRDGDVVPGESGKERAMLVCEGDQSVTAYGQTMVREAVLEFDPVWQVGVTSGPGEPIASTAYWCILMQDNQAPKNSKQWRSPVVSLGIIGQRDKLTKPDGAELLVFQVRGGPYRDGGDEIMHETRIAFDRRAGAIPVRYEYRIGEDGQGFARLWLRDKLTTTYAGRIGCPAECHVPYFAAGLYRHENAAETQAVRFSGLKVGVLAA